MNFNIASDFYPGPTSDPPAVYHRSPLAVSPLFGFSMSPLETRTEVAQLKPKETVDSPCSVTVTSAPGALLKWCIPCGKDLPLTEFYPSAINNNVKRCKKCANAQVYSSCKRQRARNPRLRFVAGVQKRVRAACGEKTPSWIGTAGAVQSLLEAAGWKSALSGAMRQLTLIQRDTSLGEWEPQQSVCVTTDEALLFPKLFGHTCASRR